MTAVLPFAPMTSLPTRPDDRSAPQYRTMLAAMHRLHVGICILDERGRITFQNAEFSRQLGSHSSCLKATGETLKFVRPLDQSHFQSLKAHARKCERPHSGAFAMTRNSFLCLEIVPLHLEDEFGSTEFDGYLVYSTDTGNPICTNIGPLQQAFGLTDAEIALADLIGNGLTNAQIAVSRDRAIATINGQVKSILAKTRCATRTQFVRLMMSFGAVYSDCK